jgi:hypothetical protein
VLNQSIQSMFGLFADWRMKWSLRYNDLR